MLSVLGYIPGYFLAIALYQVATKAIQMPFTMTVERAVMVGTLTLVMCGLSGAVALQKARVPCDLHIYQKGGHGMGLAAKPPEFANPHPWAGDLVYWLKQRGFAR